VSDAAADPVIRDATPEDVPAIREIYAHHVLTGTASFEETPPDGDEMLARYRGLVERGYPYRVAVRDGAILGYAYAGPYRPRPAYRYTVENSVYLHPDAQRQGIGRRLLVDLIAECEARDFRLMLAIVGDSGHTASIGLHAACGFTHVGTIRSVGYKFGRWLDSVLMQRPLGPGDTTPPGPRS
jgi:L-amino acid N-acyltransferase YncA